MLQHLWTSSYLWMAGRLGLRVRPAGERGGVATEYGLLLALVAMGILAAAVALGLAITSLFDRAATAPPLGGGP